MANQPGQRAIAQLKSIQNVGHIPTPIMAKYVAKRARDYAPVDTGYLRDHIHALEESETSAVVVSGAPYSEHVEFGTVYMAAQPFLRPAIADAAIHLPEMSVKELNAEIRRRVNRA